MSETENRYLAGFQSRAKQWTPDFIALNTSQWKFIPVFIYDNLRKGCRRNDILGASLYFGGARSTVPHWMLKKTDDGNSVVGFTLNRGGKTDRGTLCPNLDCMSYLKGELYGMPLRKLCELDRLYMNGVVFKRTKEYFCTSQQPEGTNREIVEAYVYTGIQDYWAPKNDNQLFNRPDSAKIYTGMQWFSYYKEIQSYPDENFSMAY